MSDEQNSASAEDANAQNMPVGVEESSAGPAPQAPAGSEIHPNPESKVEQDAQAREDVQTRAEAQAKLVEFMTSARTAYESAKASEDEGKKIVDQLKQMLTEAKDVLDKITESNPKFAAAATAVEITRTAVAGAASEVEAKRSVVVGAASEVEAKRSAVAAHTEQIAGDQKRATDVRAELETLLVNAKQTQAKAEGFKQNAESAGNSAAQADAEIVAIKATVDANAKEVAESLAASNIATAKTKSLAEKASALEQRIKDYEDKLDDLAVQCAAQLGEIKSLLPGATSAGLASAFDRRRQTFLNPTKRWEQLFVGSVVFLALLALASLIEAYFHTPELTYQQLLTRWISRIPFAAALVWLAVYASRESALAKRLEEDYGFKVSVASSFQGFQEQMKVVGAAAAGNEPLKTLCDATLAQITNPPGRIYEKHPLTVSPSEELLKAVQTALDAAKAAKPLG